MKNKSALKIGLVLDDSLDSSDGVQQYVLTLGSWLTQQGHSVHYLVGETWREDIPNVHSLSRNLRVRFNGNTLSSPLPARGAELRALIGRERFDVLHVQVPYSPFLAGRLMRAVNPKTAVVGTFHILPYDRTVELANRGLALLNRWTDRRFDRMIANSQPAADFARQTYGYASTIIPNPFPLARYTVRAPRTDGVPTIVFLGRLVRRKGPLQLLQAVQYLRQYNLYDGNFRVLIGGQGRLRPTLQRFIAVSGLGDVVELRGFVPEADKAVFLAQADIAVFPSISGESFGISLLEALAAARGVVIGGDNPGYRTVLEPLGEDTHLVDPANTGQFAALLAEWLRNGQRRHQAARGQKRYVQQFDIEAVGPQIVQVYNEALRQRRNLP